MKKSTRFCALVISVITAVLFCIPIYSAENEAGRALSGQDATSEHYVIGSPSVDTYSGVSIDELN